MYRPILLIDIDGVISLFGFDHRHRPAGRFVTVDGVPHLLSESAAAELLRLTEAFEPVWCSGWEEKADEYLPHALGLPSGLQHLSFASAAAGDGRHWKLAAIDRYAGPDRPLAWIDDGHDPTCHAWAAQRPGPTLLVATDPASGLTAEHTAALLDWADALTDA
jgi:HAD domain in Swiss Army Knife RNA repair proteins